MTYRDSDPYQLELSEVLEYLAACGLRPEQIDERAGPSALWDVVYDLYNLIGPDPSRVKVALAVLELVEEARRRRLFVHFAPDDGYVAGDVSVSHVWDSRDTVASEVVRKPGRDIGDACRRLLAQLKGGGP